MSQKARKFWAIFVLVVGLPVWIVLAINIADWINRDSIIVELVVFVVLGIVWIFPFKNLFKGVAAMPPEDRED